MTQELTKEELRRRHKTRTILIVMLLMFSAPYIVSFILYKYGNHFDLGSTNYGQFLEPRVPLESIGFEDLENKDIDQSAYKDKWLILAIGSSVCDDSCKANLFKMRQIRRLMGVDRAWIRRAYALTDKKDLEGLHNFMRDYEGTDLFFVDEEARKKLELSADIEPGTLNNRMLLIDPMGDIILFYSPDPDPKGVYGDLEKVYDVFKKATGQR